MKMSDLRNWPAAWIFCFNHYTPLSETGQLTLQLLPYDQSIRPGYC